jgi:ABC-type Na+ efflux pump permease subunit
MSSPAESCSVSTGSLEPEKQPLKSKHSCREGGQYFANFRNIYIFLVLAVIVLVIFGTLLIINGHYSSTGHHALYAITHQPWPGIKLKDENKSASYLELLERVYFIVGSLFIILAVLLIFPIHVLRKTIYSKHPWERATWNSNR